MLIAGSDFHGFEQQMEVTPFDNLTKRQDRKLPITHQYACKHVHTETQGHVHACASAHTHTHSLSTIYKK